MMTTLNQASHGSDGTVLVGGILFPLVFCSVLLVNLVLSALH
jgi:hypothetical protein